MSMSEFKVGDRVVGISPHDGLDITGQRGTIIHIGAFYCVQFDDSFDELLHAGAGYAGKPAHCWECSPSVLEALPATINEGNPIYSYRASDELTSDAWGSLVMQTVIMADDDLKPTFKAWEGEYTSVTALPVPGAWRSAKSVIVNARKWEVPVISIGGETRGKTAVEQEIKAKKDGSKDVLTPQEKLDKMIQTAMAFSAQNGLGFLDTVRGYFKHEPL